MEIFSPACIWFGIQVLYPAYVNFRLAQSWTFPEYFLEQHFPFHCIYSIGLSTALFISATVSILWSVENITIFNTLFEGADQNGGLNGNVGRKIWSYTKQEVMAIFFPHGIALFAVVVAILFLYDPTRI